MSSYDEFVETTWLEGDGYTDDQAELSRIALGICGESGEAAELIKKYMRGDGLLDQGRVLDELGDIVYYITVMSHRLGADLDTVIRRNVVKLSARSAKGSIRGSGEDR